MVHLKIEILCGVTLKLSFLWGSVVHQWGGWSRAGGSGGASTEIAFLEAKMAVPSAGNFFFVCGGMFLLHFFYVF